MVGSASRAAVIRSALLPTTYAKSVPKCHTAHIAAGWAVSPTCRATWTSIGAVRLLEEVQAEHDRDLVSRFEASSLDTDVVHDDAVTVDGGAANRGHIQVRAAT